MKKRVKDVFKYIARKETNAHTIHPVLLSNSDKQPEIDGEYCHYTNRSGELIRYPSAYSNVGWSSMIYVNSSIHVKAGRKCVFKKLVNDYEELINEHNFLTIYRNIIEIVVDN